MVEMFFIALVISTGFSAYYFGKFKGTNETFEYLEKEGKIISKDDLNKLIK